MHYASLTVRNLPGSQYTISMVDDGTGQIAFAWGDVMSVRVNYGGTEAGFYGPNANPLTASFSTGNSSNYSYSVSANPVNITEGGIDIGG